MERTIGEWQKILDLGEGGFGVVSLWRNRTTKKTIAIKCCKRVALSSKQQERWCKEVEMVKAINHPNIISYEVLPTELEEGISNPSKLPMLPMEYCSGGNLRFMLKRPCNASGLQEADVRIVLEDMIEAVSYLHQLEIVHRDFKPENIVLKETTERKCGVIYKLIDLGFAKELETMLSIVGTEDYAAPEIFMGQKYNIGVDYWSFGITAYEIICGNKKYPFPLSANVPERLKCLQQKEHHHISIYKNSLNQLSYSSKINHKCHLSSRLKEGIENWLQQPLEYDGNKRCSPNPLHELKLLLKQKILTVFVVYTLQFYYYDINENTSMSSIKTWICRDTKIAPVDQLLLTGKILGLPSDNDLLINTILDDDPVIYVFHKYSLWRNSEAKLPSPDFLTDNRNTVDKSTALSSIVFCILNETKHFGAVAKSELLLNEYVKLLFKETVVCYEHLSLVYHKLVTVVEFCDSIRKQLSRNNFDKQTEFTNLISIVHNISTKIFKLKVRIEQLKSCEQMVIKTQSVLDAVLAHHLAELERQIDKAAANIAPVEKSKTGKVAFDIISNMIKKRRETLRYLKSETRVQAFAIEEIPKLKEWITLLKDNIRETTTALRSLFFQQYECHSRSLNNNDSVQDAKFENGFSDYKRLIQNNKSIRLQLEKAINDGLRKFRMQCEITENFLHSLPEI